MCLVDDEGEQPGAQQREISPAPSPGAGLFPSIVWASFRANRNSPDRSSGCSRDCSPAEAIGPARQPLLSQQISSFLRNPQQT